MWYENVKLEISFVCTQKVAFVKLSYFYFVISLSHFLISKLYSHDNNYNKNHWKYNIEELRSFKDDHSK